MPLDRAHFLSKARQLLEKLRLMRSCRRVLCCLALVGATVAGTPAFAQQAVEFRVAEKANEAAPRKFKDAQEALQAGIERYQAGDLKSSVAPLTYAANGGAALAQWKLGKMYAAGEGVQADDYKAFQYFSKIVDGFDEDTTPRRQYSMVASAFVAVGVYSLNGIGSVMPADPHRAMHMFQYAAINFGDSDAQYNLARMYLDGAGVEKDGRQAARWLRLAAEKGHMPSQALLGHLLFTGRDGVGRRRAQGLMYLTLARESASDAARDRWIVDFYDSAMAQASDSERQTALADLESYLRKR
jgi:hypothetical protein